MQASLLRKRFISIAATCLLTCLSVMASCVAFAQDFVIDRFHSNITIQADASFTVEETIRVEFSRPRHGIYREVPYKYVDELGKTLRTPLEVLSVTDASGTKWKYRVARQGNVINIRIGDPDKYVTGRQTYVITYRVENEILFFDDHDELYWNVTGNAWKAPIRAASAKVVLAAGGRSSQLQSACYTGVQGSRESACGSEASESVGEFFTRRHLDAGEGFTIAFGWDKGLVSQPSSLTRFLWTVNLSENWVFLVPALSLLFMLGQWRERGRDPRVRDAVTVMYGPPKWNGRELSPAEVGTLIDEKLHPRDITSAIIGLAVKGYIQIKEVVKEGWIFNSTDHELLKVREPDENLCPFEKELMRRVFPLGAVRASVSDMKNKFYKNVDLLKGTIYDELVDKGYFRRSPESVRRIYLIGGIILSGLGAVALELMVPSAVGKGLLAGMLTGLPAMAFSRAMPAKTRAGAVAHMDILGFQEFLSRAEKDRLERLADQNLFSKFLPYAMALDVADNWAKAFEGIYQEPPQWYVSSTGFRAFSPQGFSRSIGSMSSFMATAMFSAPRGSGSGGGLGGGGSSGGGFGGGGGGSW